MADKLDPFDVGALEKSLNDSATRVSAIWITFLTFGLYLVIAAGTITHRQLFLEDPIKLPVLNIELPLIGFFFLAPILFVIFHAYVLLQVLLLGRTAAAYNEAVEHTVKVAADNARVRQRLANTLFAQIFAGSPRERDGWLGILLKMMAWITLAIAPVLILLVFQFKFLPYHSHFVTWMHRLSILVELGLVFAIWPMALDPKRDMIWRRFFGLWIKPAALVCLALYGFLSLSLFTFPGEPHAEWTRWPDEETRTTAHKFGDDLECETRGPVSWVSANFDRLSLPRVDIVDDEALRKIEEHTKATGEPDYQGERTRLLRERDFDCADFSDTDLRRVDLAYASLRGATFDRSKLQGASFEGAVLRGASLAEVQLQGALLNEAQLERASFGGDDFGYGYTIGDLLLWVDIPQRAQLQDASLVHANLQGASLSAIRLQGASLVGAYLEGASLSATQLQGAFLVGAQLQGASLDYANLQGASLNNANIQGASLDNANLQGASLRETRLQGASLRETRLQGASLFKAQLQGANLIDARFTETVLSNAAVWRARNAHCRDARVEGGKYDAILQFNLSKPDNSVRATPEATAKFIENSVAGIPDPKVEQQAIDRMRAGLIVDSAKDDMTKIANVWHKCEEDSAKISRADFDKKHAAFCAPSFATPRKAEPPSPRGSSATGFLTTRSAARFPPSLRAGCSARTASPAP